MKKMNKKGFTIVELVIVIAVIAILAAVLIPTFAGVIKKANQSADLQGARNAFTSYYSTLSASALETLNTQNLVFEGKNYDYEIKASAVVNPASDAAFITIAVTGTDTKTLKITPATGYEADGYTVCNNAAAVEALDPETDYALVVVNGTSGTLYLLGTTPAEEE